MKAVIFEKYGSPDVLNYTEFPTPVPGKDEVLIKVEAAALNAMDWHMLRAEPFVVRFAGGLFKPKFPILGADVAGTVEEVGDEVQRFKPGDKVFGDLSSNNCGGFAEYACAKAKYLQHRPDNLSAAACAAIPLAGLTALQALKTYGDLSGKQVMVHGASGGVGTYAVQLAKNFGAKVTAVCSTAKVEMVKSLGADHVIDYRKEDFLASGVQYDLILGVNGSRQLKEFKQALKPQGLYLGIGGSNSQIFQSLLLGPFLSEKGKKLRAFLAKPNEKDLLQLKEFAEADQLKAVIDRHFPLEKLPEAMEYLEEGHARGKIIIDVA